MLPRIHRTQANANHSQFCEGPGFIDWMTHESPPERPWLFCPESESPPLFFLSTEESPQKFHNKHREGSHLEMQALKKHKVLGKKNKFPWHLRASEQLKSWRVCFECALSLLILSIHVYLNVYLWFSFMFAFSKCLRFLQLQPRFVQMRHLLGAQGQTCDVWGP